MRTCEHDVFRKSYAPCDVRVASKKARQCVRARDVLCYRCRSIFFNFGKPGKTENEFSAEAENSIPFITKEVNAFVLAALGT